jgi:hypothetical protein
LARGAGTGGLRKKRNRNIDKQRGYFKKWYKKHGHRYNAARVREYAQRPASVEYARLRGVAHELRALRQLAESARRWSSAQRKPLRRHAYKLINGARHRSATKIDYDIEWLVVELKKAVDSGLVSLDRQSPDYASLDQRIGGLGYHRDNIQIVPLWYNLAKWQWTDADITAAVTRWVFTRALQ